MVCLANGAVNCGAPAASLKVLQFPRPVVVGMQHCHLRANTVVVAVVVVVVVDAKSCSKVLAFVLASV